MGIKDLDGKDVVNTALRLAATLYEPQTRISKGTYKTLEGIVDYGAGLVGGIGGLFNKDFQDNVRKFIEVDAVGKMWDGLGLSKVEEMSYVNELGFVGEVGRDVAEGVGGMLPSLALSLIPGVGPAIGTAVTGVSAGGKSMESALAKGAGYGNSLAYGTIAGVAEGAIEKLGGAVLGEGTSLVGKALAGTALGNATSKGLGKVAMTFASEAGEELLSDVIDPLNSFVTGVDKNIGENYKETFKPENLLKTAIVGGTVGSVMQGGNVAMNASKNKATGRGGLKATFADDSLRYIQEVSKNYGNDAVKNAKYDKAIAMSLNEISKNITKLDEGSRANYLNSIGPLKNAFDDKGNVKSTAMAKDVNQEAISSNLRAISGTVKYAPVKSSETISEGARNVKSTIEKVIGEGANVVITNDAVSGDALFNPDDDVIYVNNKANITQKSLAYAIGLHEVTHATEGTEAYVELMNTLEELTKDEKTPQEVLDIIGDIRLRKLKTAFAYRKDLEERGEKSAKYLIDTEVGSDLMGDLLGNDYFIEKLAHRNDSLVKKMYHSITSLIKRKNADLSKDSIKYLNKLASKFARAIDNRRGGVKLSDIGAMDDEWEENEVENVDIDSNERYNKKRGTYSQYRSLAMQWANATNTKKGSTKMLYNALDNTWNLIVADDSDMGYSELVSVEDTKQNKNYINSLFDEVKNESDRGEQETDKSISEDFVSYWDESGYSDNDNDDASKQGANGRIGDFYAKQSSSDGFGDFRKSYSDSGRINENEVKNESDKFDSEGNNLSLEQAKYFANSKVRDKNGNLLVVYHGTENDFNVFKSSSGFNEFFFTDSIEASKDYGSKTKTVYLNLENPYVIDYEGGFDKQILDDIDYAKAKGYDGVIALNTYDGANTHNQYVAFKKNQIKNVDNKAPTDKFDIRYSRRTTGDDLDVDFVKDEDGSIRITTNDLERAQKLEKKRRNNSGEDKLEVAEEQRKESLRGLIGEEVIEEVSASNEVTRLRKYIADNMHLKKYDSKDAIAIIDELMGIIELSDEKNPVFAKLKGKKQTEVKRMLVDALNTKEPGERNGVALEIARYLIYNTTITDAYESNEDVGLALNIIETLKPYLHGINLDNIKGEINVKYDKNKSAYAMWSKKKGERGVSADMVAQALEDELGIKVEAINEADIFLELDDMYRNAKRVIRESIPEKSILGEVLNSKEAHELEQKLAKEILLAYDKYGKETKFSKLQQRYEGKISDLTKRLKDAGIRNTLENRILKEIQKLKDSKNGKYANATQHHTEALNGIKSLLSKINSREQINRSSTREILSKLDEWYTDDNPILTNNAVKDDKNKESKGFYSSAVKEMLSYFKETVEYVENGEGEAVKKAEKPLTTTELEMVNKVLAHVNHVIENYGKIFRFGKYVEAGDISSEMQDVLTEAKENQSGFASMLQRSLLTNAVTIKWAQYFSDVELVMSQWDGHEDGFFSQSYRELVLGLIGQKADEMEILREYDEFERTHKKYMKKLKSDKNTINVTFTVNTREGTIKDINIPRYAAIDLYMVSKTGEAMKTLEETGWYLDTDESHERKDANPITKEQIKELEKQFTEEDRELIKILEKVYNEDCKKLKHNTDMKRMGFSNIITGYYYPIHRISSTSIDSNEMLVEMERVSNISANKSRVKGAKNAIIVGNCLTKFKRHVNAVTRYANLSIPIENINVLLNLDTNDNPNKPTSIRTMIESSKMWNGAIDYLRKLADSVQQVGVKDDVGGKIISFLRGSFAKYQLGANPKVWFSQLSSYLAAYGELRFTSLARAGTIKGAIKDSDVDKYCQLAAIRHYEMGATKAMAVSERIGAVGELLSKPIEAVDRGVIKMLYAACQAEAESVHKLKVGTEENKIKAGEILERVILRTQQNQLVTEQSAAMRSKSEFVRAFTMFNADSMKMVSRWLQSVGELSTLIRKLKKAKERGDTKRIEEHNTRIKKARKSLAKYSASIIAISAYMTLLAKGFKLLYNKDDEEPFWDWFFGGIWDNMIGMLPLVRDVYSYYNDGYEVDTFLTETVNNVLSSTKQTMDMFGDLVDGKAVSEQDIAKNTKALVYAIGQVFGIPFRNMYNFVTGITRRINDGAGLAVDSFFQEPSEANIKDKLSKAISEGDSVTERVSIDLLLSNRDISIEDNVLKKEMDRLIKLNLTKEETDKNDYSPFIRKIPEILTIDGEEVEISTKDKNTFKTGLKTAERDNAKMVKTLMYKKLDDESKAYCLRVVYNFHHQSSMASTSDEAKTRLVYFGGSVEINILALIMAFAKDAKSDTRQSRREKIEAYVRSFGLSPVKASLALRCVGYSDKDRDGMVERYINSMRGLSKEERDEFLHYAKIG